MGTALAINLSKKSAVSLLFRSAEEADAVRESRINRRYLPEARIPAEVRISADYAAVLEAADLVLIASPVSAFSEVLAGLVGIRKEVPVIWSCKGLCPLSGEPLSVEAERTLGAKACFGVFSGPSFAAGLAANEPTAVVVATSGNHKKLLKIASGLSNESLRVYANSDLIGVQICGAIKNVYAIAAGVIDGCGWRENTRAAMITRAVAEAKCYLEAHHCKRSTLMGLSGFGDIYLTCGSRASRNYQVGMALAAGKTLEQALAGIGHVAEGTNTARLILKRAKVLGVDMPLVQAVNDVLDGSKTPHECVAALMTREIRHEKSGNRKTRH
jgi:glycerol-3-phosphate dehydrogenase (NAD(P)+)